MSKSLSGRGRRFTKRDFGLMKNGSQPRPSARIRLTLEALEERALLSLSGVESIIQPPVLEAERYAIQETVNYISNYESTLAAVQQTLVNLEKQAVLALDRVESGVVLTVVQLIQQTLFPTAILSNSNVPFSATALGPSGGQDSIGQTSNGQSSSVQTAFSGSAENLSPERGSGQAVGSAKNQASQSPTTSTIIAQPLTPSSGTWTQLTNTAPDSDGIGTMILLSNGDVMAQGGGGTGLFPSTAWYELTPNKTGSYINGSWSNLASMSTERTFYGSNVLPDGHGQILHR